MNHTIRRIPHVLAYHNGVPVMLALLFLASGTVLAASPDARGAVIGGVSIETTSVDNSAIITADLTNFDPSMEITGVTEDADNYLVSYQYRTYAVTGDAWQETERSAVLTVPKSASVLATSDLKTYVTEKLREVAENDLVYLKRVQAIEVAQGRSVAAAATSYRGLVGLTIELKDTLLPPAPGIQVSEPHEAPAVALVTATAPSTLATSGTSSSTPVISDSAAVAASTVATSTASIAGDSGILSSPAATSTPLSSSGSIASSTPAASLDSLNAASSTNMTSSSPTASSSPVSDAPAPSVAGSSASTTTSNGVTSSSTPADASSTPPN